MIPVCDLKRQYASLKDEIDAAMQAVAQEARYILGPNVKALEKEVADFCQCEWGIGVGNGTDALHLALRALKIGPGDEVITTPFTFVATTEAIGIVGATPVFVDIDPATCNMDVSQIEAAITDRTKAILPVHLYGQPCDMDPIMELAAKYGLAVVEDCAQAIGATYKGRPVGSFGDAGCLSFFPSKNLGGFGDGGMVITSNPEVFERVEMLRRHGGRVKYHHQELGLNSRLDELQAAILRVKLAHLSDWCQQRRQNAYRYNALLADLPSVQRPREKTPKGYATPVEVESADSNGLLTTVYHQYTVQVDDRETVCQRLKDRGVGHAIYYPVPLHLQEVHTGLGYAPGSFPQAEAVSQRCLSLPMFPELQSEEIESVVGTFREVLTEGTEHSRTRAA